jgi:hypothetical protein
VADAANPHHLSAAGLDHLFCAGVLALTNDDETNLAVTMTARLLRPDLPVVSRTVSATIAERMHAFGSPTVVNPFDQFGEHLRLALNAPASYQLLTWLEAGPGAELPERGRPPTDGRWVMCAYGRFGREVTADLRAAGLEGSPSSNRPSWASLSQEWSSGTSPNRRCWPGLTSRAPPDSWPAPTTTRPTSPCLSPRAV